MAARKPRDSEREAEIARRVLRHWHEAVPGDRMAHLVKDAMRAFNRSLQARLAAHDVAPGHWVFLRVLWQRDGLTKRDLSIEAGVMEPTTFVALRAMEALGYVTLQRRPDNRKNIYVWLTPLGRRLERKGYRVVFALDGVLLGAGDVVFLRKATMFSALCGFLPLIWLSLVFGWGLAGIWSGLVALMVLRLVLVVGRVLGGRWQRVGADAVT